MARSKQSMDGNTAAAHVSYAFTDVAGIYPITPSSVMAELTDAWSAGSKKNIFGREVKVIEMQSEAGAAGTVHGSLAAGALTTTYTASQGLLLMIPNMYKIAGELLPCVIHVSARAVASHALSIFGDHSDVYACRQTGFAMLCETNPQEVMDLGAVAHLATIRGRVPFLNFFDGFRTSHEIQKIEAWDYDTLDKMVDHSAINDFRKNSLNPERPILRGSAQNPDIFFQWREAANKYYNELPAIVEEEMARVNAEIGTDYQLFNYYGAPDADRIIIAMGSVCDTIEEVIDYMTAAGEKVGLLKVRLYRPFCADRFFDAIPKSAKSIAVLDRTKEPGALGEPLFMDVATVLAQKGFAGKLVGGRYGLGSKDTTPGCVFAVYENLAAAEPKTNFTVGIEDDVTGLSLPITKNDDTSAEGTISCKFWGLGGDGTVGANKNSIKIIGDHTDMFSQAYFQYDSKKTGGVTISHLRFGKKPIKSTYYVNKADFVACHTPSYLTKGFPIVRDIKPGGTFLVNCQWTPEEFEEHLSGSAKRHIANNNIKVYLVDAITKAREIGMGKRTNTILQSAFFVVANIIPMDEAITYMKEAAKKSYSKKGDEIVKMNYNAIDAGKDAIVEFKVPAEWANAADNKSMPVATGEDKRLVDFVNEVVTPSGLMHGDDIPVSVFAKNPDGMMPQGTAAFEKRGVAVDVPKWIPENCIQCNQCSYVCPHAAIRPFVLSEGEASGAPAAMLSCGLKGKGNEAFIFSQSVDPLDCMGCGLCANVCPAKNKALVMEPLEDQLAQQEAFDFCVANVEPKELTFDKFSIKGSQFEQPLLEFSGACAGCVETAYAKLITQLFGERMYVANATGCSSIWGGSAPSTPYTKNKKTGYGVTWANSLFEDNAEFGFGMQLGQKAIRERLIAMVEALDCDCEERNEYLATVNDGEANRVATDKLIAKLESCGGDAANAILAEKEYLAKKSVWIFGGDGWAYDIGFGGLDHVIASGDDVNIMVFDTEVYSNTGGQASKASQIGQVAQFAAAGKSIGKKDLASIAMSYGYVYVAHIGMGADMNQTIKAIKEAESYPGPSIIIGYSPCEMHGVKGGMGNSQLEIKRAVQSGYWHLFRFDPRRKAEGANPFIMDSKAPTESYEDFIKSETRYTRLAIAFPERAEALFDKAADTAKNRYDYLMRLSNLY